MTAHTPKPTITLERVEWFARYYLENAAWGVFHVCLDDGNWELGAAYEMHRPGAPTNLADPACWMRRAEWPADVLEHALWFETLSPSQRRRLGRKAEDKAGELRIVSLSRRALAHEADR